MSADLRCHDAAELDDLWLADVHDARSSIVSASGLRPLLSRLPSLQLLALSPGVAKDGAP